MISERQTVSDPAGTDIPVNHGSSCFSGSFVAEIADSQGGGEIPLFRLTVKTTHTRASDVSDQEIKGN